MKLKLGVKVHGVIPEIVVAMMVADELWRHYDKSGVTVTSVVDGQHTKYSRHYWGGAVDFRIRDIDSIDRPGLVNALRRDLGEDYNVILEADHIHVGWKPLKLG